MNDTIEVLVEPGGHTCKFATDETPAELRPSTPRETRPSPSDAPERRFCRSFSCRSSFPAWRSRSDASKRRSRVDPARKTDHSDQPERDGLATKCRRPRKRRTRRPRPRRESWHRPPLVRRGGLRRLDRSWRSSLRCEPRCRPCTTWDARPSFASTLTGGSARPGTRPTVADILQAGSADATGGVRVASAS
jgi:hypothetical protein